MMNIFTFLDMVADGLDGRVLVGPRSGGLTGQALRELATAKARELVAAGADSLVYLDVNGPAFPVALFAAARAGVPLVPLNYRLGREQLTALLRRHPAAFRVAGQAQLDVLAEAGIPAVETGEWLASDSADRVALPEPDPDATAALIYTSGTTSEPKGVVVRHANLAGYVLGTVEFGAANPGDAMLISVPPYHIAGVANVLTNLYAGRRVLVLERFTPEGWLATVRAEKITNAMVVPTMLARIVESDADTSTPALRSVAYGGAAMPVRVIRQALRMWPHVDFVNAYGLTETSSTIAVLGPDDHRAALASDDPVVRARLSSAGRPIPGVEISIRDEAGRPVPAGVAGRIHVRGAQVSAEYAGVGRIVDGDGYFDTRDEGYLDAGGFLFIGGRTDDTIIRGAENIAPAEIEDVLLRHPQVRDVAVVGVPDEEWGQRVEAAVVLRTPGGAGEDELRELVRTTLRASKTPDRIIFVDELPRTETGKIVRRHILGRLAGATAV